MWLYYYVIILCDYVVWWKYTSTWACATTFKNKNEKKAWKSKYLSRSLSLARSSFSLRRFVSFRLVVSSWYHDGLSNVKINKWSQSLYNIYIIIEEQSSAPQLLYKCIIYDEYRDDIMTHRSAPLRCSPLRCVRVSPAGDNHNGHQCAYQPATK